MDIKIGKYMKARKVSDGRKPLYEIVDKINKEGVLKCH